MLDKVKNLGKLAKIRGQAKKLQKVLSSEEVVIHEGSIKIVISGDQKFKEVIVNGQKNKALVDALNKAIKKSQKLAAKKLQGMEGGLDMLGL